MTSRFLIFLFITLLLSCGSDSLVLSPKPRAFPRIDFPARKLAPFTESYCPFRFDYADYNKLIKDTLFFNSAPENECWFDLNCPSLNSYLHCSYYPIDEKNSLDKLITDAFVLSNKHNIKANYIDEFPISKEGSVYGYVFDIEGDVASPFQFYLTDSTDHFLRGSLYIKAKARPDSLAPVYEFLKEDIMGMINSFEWK